MTVIVEPAKIAARLIEAAVQAGMRWRARKRLEEETKPAANRHIYSRWFWMPKKGGISGG